MHNFIILDLQILNNIILDIFLLYKLILTAQSVFEVRGFEKFSKFIPRYSDDINIYMKPYILYIVY